MSRPTPTAKQFARDIFPWYFYLAAACFHTGIALEVLDVWWLAGLAFGMAILSTCLAATRARLAGVQFSIATVMFATGAFAIGAAIYKWFDIKFVAVATLAVLAIFLVTTVVAVVKKRQ